MLYENRFFSFVNKLVDATILGFLFLLYSIPIITIGASMTAFYSQAIRIARDHEGSIIKGFHKCFCAHLKTSTLYWILLLIVGFILVVDWFYFIQSIALSKQPLLMYIFLFSCSMYLLISIYLFPLLSQFENTVTRTFFLAGFMPIKHLGSTIILLACYCLLYYLTMTISMEFFFLWFGLIGLAQSYIFSRIFTQYTTNNKEFITENKT